MSFFDTVADAPVDTMPMPSAPALDAPADCMPVPALDAKIPAFLAFVIEASRVCVYLQTKSFQYCSQNRTILCNKSFICTIV